MTKVLGPGSRKTLSFAKMRHKPSLHIHASNEPLEAAVALRNFIKIFNIRTLNVAGSRGSKEPEISNFVRAVLNAAINDDPALPVQ